MPSIRTPSLQPRLAALAIGAIALLAASHAVIGASRVPGAFFDQAVRIARIGGVWNCGKGSCTPPVTANRVAFAGTLSPVEPGKVETRRVFVCIDDGPVHPVTGEPLKVTCSVVQVPGS